MHTVILLVFCTPGDNLTTAEELSQRVRVLCFIPAADNSLQEKGKAVMATWGRRCNKLIFFTNSDVPGFPTIPLNVHEKGSRDLTNKVGESAERKGLKRT